MPVKARHKIVPFLLVVSLIHSSNNFKLSNVGLPLRFAFKRWGVFEPVAYVRDPALQTENGDENLSVSG